MIEVGVLTALFVLEILKYQKAYELFYSKRLDRLWISIPMGIGLFIFFIIDTTTGNEVKYLVSYAMVIVELLWMMRDKWYRRLGNVLVLLFTINTSDLLIDTFIQFARNLAETESKLKILDTLIISTVTLTILYIIIYVKEKEIIKRIWNSIYNNVQYLVIVMACFMILTIAGLNYAERHLDNSRFSIVIPILCGLSYCAIGIIGIFVLYIRRNNMKMKEMLQNEMILKDMQKHYYEALLEKEEDTRRYRHDMANHMMCLNSLAQWENLEELKSYLQKMQEQAQVIQKKCYTTGNQVLDVITNYYLNSLEGVDIKISGQVSPSLAIDSVSLCTIFANLIKNAFEELARNEENKRVLNINFRQGTEYFQLIITNSLSEESKKKENIFITKKDDKKNHGIGLKNVQKAVEEWGGEIKFDFNETIFGVEVILPLNDHSRS